MVRGNMATLGWLCAEGWVFSGVQNRLDTDWMDMGSPGDEALALL